MKDFSFILSARDDNYTGNFIERFSIALKENLNILDKSGLNYEIIVVDYNPDLNKRLIDNYILKELLIHPNVRNIIVDRSILVDDNLPENGFYEYYAKNIGAIKSNGEFLFMTNADIIISDEIINYLKTLIGKDSCNFYRLRYRQEIQNGQNIGNILDLHWPDDVDEPICGVYAGDATIFPRKLFIDVATGYNEIDPNHRTPNGQASMDGEILWNLVKRGYEKILVDLTYYHVHHQRQPKDSFYCKEKYINRENWGCKYYPNRVINENTIEIYK